MPARRVRSETVGAAAERHQKVGLDEGLSGNERMESRWF